MILAIVLTRDHPEFLRKSLPSVRSAKEEISGIVVDNSEGPEPARIAKALGWKVIGAEPGISFAAGHNLAVGMAHPSDHILLVNDDAVLGPGDVDQMLDHAAESDVVGALILDRNGSVNHAGTGLMGQPPRLRHLGHGDPPEKWRGRCAEVLAVTFAVALIRAETWRLVGGIDESYYYSFEDTDFCIKVWERGGRVAVCRRTNVRHDEFGTRTGVHDRRNSLLFYTKWMQGRAQRAFERLDPPASAASHAHTRLSR